MTTKDCKKSGVKNLLDTALTLLFCSELSLCRTDGSVGVGQSLDDLGLVLTSLPELVVKMSVVTSGRFNAKRFVNGIAQSWSCYESAVQIAFAIKAVTVEEALLTTLTSFGTGGEAAVCALQLQSVIYCTVDDIRTLVVEEGTERLALLSE